MMNRAVWLAVGLFAGSVGCAEDSANVDTTVQETEATQTGTLTLSLVGSDSLGRTYRLRNAEFLIRGGKSDFALDGGSLPNVTLSTETSPDAPDLSVSLIPGPYDVSLQGDWFVERMSPAGSERVEQVVLLTPSPRSFQVAHAKTSVITFSFGIDGELIDFRHGEATIDVAFELPEGAALDAGSASADAASGFY